MHPHSTPGNASLSAANPGAPRRPLGIGLLALAVVALAGMVGHAAPAAAANACVKQCALVNQACQVPFRLAFQTQKAGCIGVGKKLCVAAAKLLYSAGRQLCRSTATSCRKCCQRGANLCTATCGDGMVQSNEDCDPPGWASCTNGAACGNDCRCPAP